MVLMSSLVLISLSLTSIFKDCKTLSRKETFLWFEKTVVSVTIEESAVIAAPAADQIITLFFGFWVLTLSWFDCNFSSTLVSCLTCLGNSSF
ncbi:hypothetical protein NMG93_01790 [Metamycoplasma hyosynoviae]|uniref:Uncharacterized protein n=1 Tax=Metamycoplasma hyosynoviae TaxID=29559 RepID=A0A9Q9BVM9_9BACT|nr:hypothetical protein [Metamycoplasma hyosynoviae]UTO25595.1 hypothetical protein NMG93_01790 [Metamycoplasma hyosynoviae]